MLRNSAFLAVVASTVALLTTPASAATMQGQWTFGIEGFTDTYQEPAAGIGVDNHAVYGGVTASYASAPVAASQQGAWWGLDGRADYGSNNYNSSISGKSDNNPQYEAELRLRLGENLGNGFSTYTGLGSRYFFDNGNNTETNLGFFGYDRQITQVYLPVGLTLRMNTGSGWSITPTAEYDALLYGRVQSDLSELGGSDVVNTQNVGTGYGLRGDIMIGKGQWQMGPFIRYWNIEDSNTVNGWFEPHNTRTQAGVALRFAFN